MIENSLLRCCYKTAAGNVCGRVYRVGDIERSASGKFKGKHVHPARPGCTTRHPAEQSVWLADGTPLKYRQYLRQHPVSRKPEPDGLPAPLPLRAREISRGPVPLMSACITCRRRTANPTVGNGSECKRCHDVSQQAAS